MLLISFSPPRPIEIVIAGLQRKVSLADEEEIPALQYSLDIVLTLFIVTTLSLLSPMISVTIKP